MAVLKRQSMNKDVRESVFFLSPSLDMRVLGFIERINGDPLIEHLKKYQNL